MRKHQQHQILEIIQTLREAQSVGLLADCQDVTLQIVEIIESIKGKGTQTSCLLNEYYELLYNVNIGESNEKQLRKQLFRIETNIKNELKANRIEVAFLSYKASMSDSIESIYLAAKADPDCDAYWIPIPYVERSADGLGEKTYYEGEGFYNENIEITSWREYDIEARHPDVIFTFSPYDDVNYITSVHPDFYCERLRNATDLLVYLPYFVTVAEVQKHFCTVPACVYAHKIIVQSEKIRQQYVDVYKGSYGSKFAKPENKFVALGSPKYDKIINLTREAYDIPDAWCKLRGNKKAILLNTSIGSILTGNEQYLEKLKEILETFHRRDDVLLWWRPHPLSEATYKSMRSRLLDEYVQIIANYRREGWGLYDDTPDPHRAIACTDVYYGDWGSMVALYQATGKPIMIQDMQTGKCRDSSPNFGYIFDDGQYLWFSEVVTNALMKMSKDDWIPEFVCALPAHPPKAKTNSLDIFGNPVKCGNSLFMTSPSGEAIVKYDIDSGMLTRVPYPPKHNGLSAIGYLGAVAYKELVFFTPLASNAIMCLNTLTNEIKFYSDWLEPLKKRMHVDAPWNYFLEPYCVGSSIWMAALGANAIIEFDMETRMHRLHELGSSGYGHSGICFDGKSFWLTPFRNTSLVKWNPKTNEVKEFDNFITGIFEASFCSPIYAGGAIWLLPRLEKRVVKIDILTDAVSIAEEFEAEHQAFGDWPSWKYWWAQASGSSIYAYNVKDRALIEYNCDTKVLRKEALQYPPETLSNLDSLAAKSFIRSESELKNEFECIYYEAPERRLEDYLNYVLKYGESDEEKLMAQKRMEVAYSVNENMDGNAGRAIYDYVKQLALKSE